MIQRYTPEDLYVFQIYFGTFVKKSYKNIRIIFYFLCLVLRIKYIYITYPDDDTEIYIFVSPCLSACNNSETVEPNTRVLYCDDL